MHMGLYTTKVTYICLKYTRAKYFDLSLLLVLSAELSAFWHLKIKIEV